MGGMRESDEESLENAESPSMLRHCEADAKSVELNKAWQVDESWKFDGILDISLHD